MDKSVEIYVMTHKEIKENFDHSLYKPILNGSANAKQDYGYIRDDSGENISKLHKNYGELTSEYWVWKNSKADIIGFCHYRRWYVKNLRVEKLNKSDILNDLEEYDIILPNKAKNDQTLYDFQKELDITNPYYDATYEDYFKVEDILGKFFPEYLDSYRKVMNGKEMWPYTFFICKREIANKYFEWLFDVLSRLGEEIDLKKYDSRDSRVFAFITERLFTAYVVKNDFKVKEYPILISGERKHPMLYVLYSKYPMLSIFEKFIYILLNAMNLK